ncbi:hypothetical protein [Sphaerisporangium album]|nr:hypothetical protein [Sphaerisporangium album]
MIHAESETRSSDNARDGVGMTIVAIRPLAKVETSAVSAVSSN